MRGQKTFVPDLGTYVPPRDKSRHPYGVCVYLSPDVVAPARGTEQGDTQMTTLLDR